MPSSTSELFHWQCGTAAVVLLLGSALPLHAQADKPREAIIAVQTKADEGKPDKPNETIRETSKLLKEKLTKAKADGGEGKDADIYLLGDMPKEAAGQDMDVPSLDRLEQFLKDKAKDKIEVADKKAQDKEPTNEKVVLTRNGHDTFTETDVIKELTAAVPTFLPLALADPATPARPREPRETGKARPSTARQPGGSVTQEPGVSIEIGIRPERRREHHRVQEHEGGRGGGGFGLTPGGFSR